MKLYRVTFATSLLVEAESEHDAERIGYFNRNEEADCELYSIERIESKDDLRRGERGSLPWRDSRRRQEPETCVEDLLGAPSQKST